MQEYDDGVKWGVMDAEAGKRCLYKSRPEHSFYQMGYYDGWLSKQDRYTQVVMRLSNRELPFYLRDQRAPLVHHKKKSMMGREARKCIAAAKLELTRRGMDFDSGPEPDEKLETLLKLFPSR